jgi:hypothetical protein
LTKFGICIRKNSKIYTRNNRIHGSTRERPLSRFVTERALLQALPDMAPTCATWAKAQSRTEQEPQLLRQSAPL